MKRTITLIAVFALLVSTGFAGTQDKTLGGTQGYSGDAGVVMIERTLNFSTATDAGTNGDTFQLFNIPAGTFVYNVGYEILDNGTYSGEDGTLTIDIGDGSDPDGYIDGANCSTGQTAVGFSYITLDVTSASVVTGVTDQASAFGTALVPTTVVYTNAVYDSGATTGNITTVSYTLTTVDALTNTVAGSITAYPSTTAEKPYAGGKLYTATDTLDLLLNNAADQLKIRIFAICGKVSGAGGVVGE